MQQLPGQSEAGQGRQIGGNGIESRCQTCTVPDAQVRSGHRGAGGLAGEGHVRWGFCRSLNPSINNARSDKIGSGTWSDAYLDRRCVLPVSLIFNWCEGIGGHKQAHEFRPAADDYLWIAGLWEEHAEAGR